VNEEGLCFAGVEPQVWTYRIGGYQVLAQWLQARAGRVLNADQSREFRWIAEALRLTLEAQRTAADLYPLVERDAACLRPGGRE
jgi:hypothetical protein